MPTKKELTAKIIELEQQIKTLETKLDTNSLGNLVLSAPEFPVNYDDKVLVIEQGFKPAYAGFLADLLKLV